MIAALHINTVLALFVMFTSVIGSAFIGIGMHERGLSRRRVTRSRYSLSLQNGDGDFDDSEGMELARQFSKTVRQRQQTPPSPGTVLESEAEDSENRREVEGGKEISYFTSPNRKFTGATNYGGSGDVVSSRSQMNIGDEFDFMNRAGAEKSIIAQGVIAALALVAVIVVGLTGGITDGSERDFGGDDVDTTVLYNGGTTSNNLSDDVSVWM